MRREYHPHHLSQHFAHFRGSMDSLRELTANINVFVRFFESVNCLFWQLSWLERHISHEHSGRLLLVAVILGFCVYYTFVCHSGGAGDQCRDTVLQVGIIGVLVAVLGGALFKRYQIQRQQQQADPSHGPPSPMRPHDAQYARVYNQEDDELENGRRHQRNNNNNKYPAVATAIPANEVEMVAPVAQVLHRF